MVFEKYSAQFDDNEKQELQEKSPWEGMSDEDLIQDQSLRIQKYVESKRYQDVLAKELQIESFLIEDNLGYDVAKKFRKESKYIAVSRSSNLHGRVHPIEVSKGSTTYGFYRSLANQKQGDGYDLEEDPLVSRAVDIYTGNHERKRILRVLEEQLLIGQDVQDVQEVHKKINQIKSDIQSSDIQSGEIVIMMPQENKFVTIHEKAHQLLDGNAQMVQTTRNFLADLLSIKKQELIDEGLEKEDVNYDFSITEVYANIIAVKYLMDRLSIVNPLKKTIKFDDLQKLCMKIGNLKDGIIKESAKIVVGKILGVMGIDFDDLIQDDYQIDDTHKYKIMDSFFNGIALQSEKSQEFTGKV